MIFREATIADIPQIQIVRNSVKENMLSNPALVTDADCEKYIIHWGIGWICEIDTVIIGFVIIDLDNYNVWAICVHPAHQGCGIGRRLHDVMLNWYFSRGKQLIRLSVGANTRAEKFYRQAGWIETSTYSGQIGFEMRKTRFDELKKKPAQQFEYPWGPEPALTSKWRYSFQTSVSLLIMFPGFLIIYELVYIRSYRPLLMLPSAFQFIFLAFFIIGYYFLKLDKLIVYSDRLIVKSVLGFTKKTIHFDDVKSWSEFNNVSKYGEWHRFGLHSKKRIYSIHSYAYSNYSELKELLRKDKDVTLIDQRRRNKKILFYICVILAIAVALFLIGRYYRHK